MAKKSRRPDRIHLETMIGEVAAFSRKYPDTTGHEIYGRVLAKYPFLEPSDRCVNCGSNMLEEIFIFDYADALLLLGMAKAVAAETDKGTPFTQANSVHVVRLPISDAQRHRTTQCSKLGLIAKHIVKNAAGKSIQKRGLWVITARGWAALRGERVPQRVAVFRGSIEERFPDTTTLSEALRTNQNKAMQIVDYSPAVWVDYGKRHEGRLV